MANEQNLTAEDEEEIMSRGKCFWEVGRLAPLTRFLYAKIVSRSSKKKKKVPKGFSSYQAAWIVESDEGESEDGEGEDGDMEVEGKGKEVNEMALVEESENSNQDEREEEEDDEEDDGWVVEPEETETIDMEAAELYVL